MNHSGGLVICFFANRLNNESCVHFYSTTIIRTRHTEPLRADGEKASIHSTRCFMKDVCLPGVNMTPTAVPLLICDSRAAALRGEYLHFPRLSEQQQQGGDRLLS